MEREVSGGAVTETTAAAAAGRRWWWLCNGRDQERGGKTEEEERLREKMAEREEMEPRKRKRWISKICFPAGRFGTKISILFRI